MVARAAHKRECSPSNRPEISHAVDQYADPRCRKHSSPLYQSGEAPRTGPVIFEYGKGVRVFDTNGKDYIEAMSGLWCSALGWGENELAEVASRQMKQMAFGHLFAGRSHEPGIALAEKLKEISPFPAGKVFFANSGSEANDTQIKLFWYINNARGKPEKKKIISRTKAYHGVTIASASLTGLPGNHKSFDLPLDFVRFADCPHYYRAAEAGESEEQFTVHGSQS